MIDSAVVRLLFEGLPPIGDQDATALPFPPEELAASPLALPERLSGAPANGTPEAAPDASSGTASSGTGTDAAYDSARTASSDAWTLREKHGLRWLDAL